MSKPAAVEADGVPSWTDLQKIASSTTVGNALDREVELRKNGLGTPHVQSKIRLFPRKDHDETKKDADGDKSPKLTLYRDYAGWCPYCEKTMLLVEEKGIPISIELIPMRSYGDKPTEFMQMVPGGLLPALAVERDDGRKQVITESQVIMEWLDRWYTPENGYKPMLPADDDSAGLARYDKLARLERELFSWWCTWMFRPEGPRMGGPSLRGIGEGKEMSSAMRGYLECLSLVEGELLSTPGPWFFGEHDYPTMIDFVYVSHMERMLASCAFWKGFNIRSATDAFPGINKWFDAFEKRECYLAFRSDFYTNVKNIPPQYGAGFDGGFDEERETYSKIILGRDGKSWKLPLPFDDPLQPLYRGPPLPLPILEAAGIKPDEGSDGTYEKANQELMTKACRQMAGWKLASNGINVSRFACRGGPGGSKNPRKMFKAQLSDPYAESDEKVLPYVEIALRIVSQVLLDDTLDHDTALKEGGDSLSDAFPGAVSSDVAGCLAFLKDRVGVPRDLPIAAARQLRAHLFWAIDILTV